MGSRLYLIRIRTVPSRTSDSWKGQIAPEQRETTLARTMAFSNLFDMVQRLKIKPQLADLKAELQAEYAMKEEHNFIPHAWSAAVPQSYEEHDLDVSKTRFVEGATCPQTPQSQHKQVLQSLVCDKPTRGHGDALKQYPLHMKHPEANILVTWIHWLPAHQQVGARTAMVLVAEQLRSGRTIGYTKFVCAQVRSSSSQTH